MSTLKDAILRHAAAADGAMETAVPGLVLMRSTQPSLPHHVNYKPSLCIVADGAKEVMLGDEAVAYGAGQSLVVNLELPLLSRVTRAPYAGLSLRFDVALLREVVTQLPRPPAESRNAPGLFVDEVSGPLADAVGRLVSLLATPDAIGALGPAITREIYYWLLTGPHGAEVAKLALPDSHTQRIARAIGLMRDEVARPIPIEELAAAARMSPSSFHQHFKLLTALSPLQYHKQLRLLEARRLMLSEALGVAGAAYKVGYESVSQFSREYARMFGRPPKRDVTDLRRTPLPAVA